MTYAEEGETWGIPGQPECYIEILPSWISMVRYRDATGKEHTIMRTSWDALAGGMVRIQGGNEVEPHRQTNSQKRPERN